MLVTPLAGRVAARIGTRAAFWSAIAVALAGLPLVLLPNVPAVLAGLVLIGAGTFFAQARPDSSAAPRGQTAAPRAGSISPATSPAGWSAPRCSAHSSSGSAGPPAWRVSARRWSSPGCSRSE
jgi:hypothetical protein